MSRLIRWIQIYTSLNISFHTSNLIVLHPELENRVYPLKNCVIKYKFWIIRNSYSFFWSIFYDIFNWWIFDVGVFLKFYICHIVVYLWDDCNHKVLQCRATLQKSTCCVTIDSLKKRLATSFFCTAFVWYILFCFISLNYYCQAKFLKCFFESIVLKQYNYLYW